MNINEKVGQWTLLSEAKTSDRRKAWRCRCECGKERIVAERYLISGKSTSCGCSKRLLSKGDKIGDYEIIDIIQEDIRVKYILKCKCGKIKQLRYDTLMGLKNKNCGCVPKIAKTKYLNNEPSTQEHFKLLECWFGIKERCYNTKSVAYKNYGARGISICNEWLIDFTIFKQWALSNGFKIGLTIDRINNDGNYEPSNCAFVSMRDNTRHTRATKIHMETANKIRELYQKGVKQNELCNIYSLSATHIHRIIHNERWAKDEQMQSSLSNIFESSGLLLGCKSELE